MRTTMHQLSVSAVRTEALFVSPLQRSDHPSVGQVREAVAATIGELGRRGCAERVAQEFGDHPEIAVTRMRWARQLAGEVFGSSSRARAHSQRPVRRLVAPGGRAA